LGVIVGVVIWYATAALDPLVTQLDNVMRRWRMPVGTGS
jgi:hypothetical protein